MSTLDSCTLGSTVFSGSLFNGFLIWRLGLVLILEFSSPATSAITFGVVALLFFATVFFSA